MEQESSGGAAVEQESSSGAGERRWSSSGAGERRWSRRAPVEQESGGGGEWWRRRAAGERGGRMHQAVLIHNSSQGKFLDMEKSGNFVMNSHDTFLAATKQL